MTPAGSNPLIDLPAYARNPLRPAQNMRLFRGRVLAAKGRQMNVSGIPDRGWLQAAGLQLAIRTKYAAETWGGLKPLLSKSLTGHPESTPQKGPEVDWQTSVGIKLLWTLAAMSRQHPLGAVAYRFSGMRFVANKCHEAMYRRVLAACRNQPQASREIPLPEFDWRNRPAEVFHQEYIKRPHPVVLRGLAGESTAGRTWTFDSFVERFADEDVLLTTKELDGEPGKLDAVRSDKVYLHNCEILFRRYPELIDDLPLDRLKAFCDMLPTHLQLFLGRRGTGSPFHSAGTWNWFLNLQGRKTWYFVDPRHGFLIYPMNAVGQAATFALCAYPDEYDRDFFPAFRHCPIFKVTLEPGDVLLNPPWWWHAVKNDSEKTVAVASRWIRGGQVGSDLRMTETDYDIDRMRSFLFFAGVKGWGFLHSILRNPSPQLSGDVTVREKRGRFAHLQRKISSEKVFGMRHRF